MCEMDISDIDNVITMGCGHSLHKVCFNDLKNHGTKVCPICRQKF